MCFVVGTGDLLQVKQNVVVSNMVSVVGCEWGASHYLERERARRNGRAILLESWYKIDEAGCLSQRESTDVRMAALYANFA